MSSKLEIFLLVSFLVVIGLFSIYKLTESPSVWYDEGFYVQIATNLSTTGKYGLQLSPGRIEPVSRLITVGYPLIYPIVLGFKLFGTSILVARSVMVVFIFGFTLAGYFLIRKMFSRTSALLALLLITSFPPLYGNGKSVLGEVPGLFFLMLAFLGLQSATTDSNRRRWWLIFGGFFTGLCLATKPTFLVVAPALAVGLIVAWRLKKISTSDIVYGLVAAVPPLVFWWATQFGLGDNLVDILRFYINPFQEKDLLLVIVNNLKHLFTDIGPLYLLAMLFLWGTSLVIRWRRRQTILPAEVAAVTFVVLILLSYLRTNGWYRFIFPAQAVALWFLPQALVDLSHLIPLKAIRRLWLAPVLILVALGFYQTMFDSWVAEAYGSQKTAFWENYFHQTANNKALFFYNVPEVAALYFGGQYYQYITPAGWQIGASGLVKLEKGLVDRVVVRTDTLAGNEALFAKYYRSTGEFYKYTILVRK